MPDPGRLLVLCVALAVSYGAGAALEDPMRPPSRLLPRPAPAEAARTVPAPRWTLNSTLVGAERRLAVINDALVRVGDRVQGADVIAIDKRSARLRYRGRELLLRLGQPGARATREGAGQ